jgi:hypothetical protein
LPPFCCLDPNRRGSISWTRRYPGERSLRIDRLELATGKRTFFREIAPADPTGVGSISSVQITPDGKSYCYSFMRGLSRLYVVDGLR